MRREGPHRDYGLTFYRCPLPRAPYHATLCEIPRTGVSALESLAKPLETILGETGGGDSSRSLIWPISSSNSSEWLDPVSTSLPYSLAPWPIGEACSVWSAFDGWVCTRGSLVRDVVRSKRRRVTTNGYIRRLMALLGCSSSLANQKAGFRAEVRFLWATGGSS